MPQVKNLKIQLQSGGGATHFASWEFDETIKNETAAGGGGAIVNGSLVSILAGATYYNGVAIPDWVMSDRWYVIQVTGDRAVLGKNEAGTNDIQSPVNTKYLSTAARMARSAREGVDPNTLDHYKVEWLYDTGDGVWFDGGSSDTEFQNATYSAPDNAIRIKVKVTPVAKTRKVNDEDVAYWNGTVVGVIYDITRNPPEDLSGAPNVEVKLNTLNVLIENINDPRCDEVKFEINNGVKLYNTGIVTVLARMASYSCTVPSDAELRVRACPINLNGNTRVHGNWTDYSSAIFTIPNPRQILELRATSETAIYVRLEEHPSADSYTLQYSTKRDYLIQGSNDLTEVTDIKSTQYNVTGLESGKEYFFRMKVITSAGESGWSDIKSVIVGKKPIAPTTWSSTTTAITGEPLNLYWVHNSQDNSSETFAELEIYIDGRKEEYTLENDRPEEDKDRTRVYPIDTSEYPEGTTIEWRVRTAGVTKQYGDWSIMRTVDVYAPPTLSLELTDQNDDPLTTITGFPFYLKGLSGPATQNPIGYHVSVSAQESYRTVDSVGNPKQVNRGEDMYTTYLDTSDPLLLEFLPSNIDLENNIPYLVTVTVAMDSGLDKTTTLEFTVSWADIQYEPDAEIGINKTNYSAYIRPYCIDEDGNAINNITLAIFRRNFDGTFTEIASGLDPTRNTFITDPHPSLDYARYRVVATANDTGAISFYDIPAYPVKCPSVILQWDDEWTNFNTDTEDALEQQPWTGSMLELKYNVDVSENHAPDVSLVNYIGRTNPVSYYGTQLGYTASWSMVIPKYDTETLYALRKLQTWMGDVYVREPSGSGYWANLKVSFSQTHAELTIPITIELTRVEGGI